MQLSWDLLKSITVNIEIFMVAIFHRLNFLGDNFLWVRVARRNCCHLLLVSTKFRGLNFCWYCLSRKISPQQKILRLRYANGIYTVVREIFACKIFRLFIFRVV